MTPDVALVCYLNADHRVGSGHLVRSRAMIEALSFPYRLYTFEKKLLVQEAFSQAIFINDTGGIAKKITQLLSDHAFVILWVDSPEVPAEIWEIEHDRLLKVAIDDCGGDRIQADIVVNANAAASHAYNGLQEWTLLLTGLKYLPIRPEFGNVGKGRDLNPTGRRVGFVIGGGDAAQKWTREILSLEIVNNKWHNVRMITSRYMPDFEDVKRIGQAKGISVITGLNANEMASFYSSCDACVMSAGMCLYEALASGTPVVAYPILSGMETEVAYFEKRNVILNLGKKGGDPKTMTDTVNSLLDSPAKRNEFSRKGRSLVDGKGIFRVAQVLMRVHSMLVEGLDKKRVLISTKTVMEKK